ncbi:hypothetical protein HRED_09562 [Candidatus Haloredivivus sp. G17]|nr:hypothetical protein HRED_09562 [Candidatus Haloredivivus sp. G17]
MKGKGMPERCFSGNRTTSSVNYRGFRRIIIRTGLDRRRAFQR